MLAQFGRPRAAATHKYRRFMGEPVESPYEEVDTHGGTVKGDEEFAEDVFRTHGQFLPKRHSVSFSRIAAAVAREYEVDAAALGRPGRYRDLSRMRAVTALVARDVAGHSVASVARHFHREESTLVRQVLNLEQQIVDNRRQRAAVERISQVARGT